MLALYEKDKALFGNFNETEASRIPALPLGVLLVENMNYRKSTYPLAQVSCLTLCRNYRFHQCVFILFELVGPIVILFFLLYFHTFEAVELIVDLFLTDDVIVLHLDVCVVSLTRIFYVFLLLFWVAVPLDSPIVHELEFELR